MIIDSHVHTGKMPGCKGTADELVALADKLGFDRVFASHLGAIKYDYHAGNRELAKDIKRFPDRLLGYVAIPSPYCGQAALDELRRGIEFHGLSGLKIYSQPGGALGGYSTLFSIANPAMYPLLAAAADLHCPVLAHCTPDECDRVMTEVPGVIMLMAHSGGMPPGLGDWQKAIAVAKRHPTVYLDTATSMFDLGFIEAAVAALGPQRVIFGTDMPLLDPWSQKARITSAEISPQERDLILGGNMQRLLGL
ncbi:MAG: amidohydrolase family protein [Anaerolineae bacterium]|nr:amidohydrolase family protein [Anaerolineae bacterium]